MKRPTKNELKKALYLEKPLAKVGNRKTEPHYIYLAYIESLEWTVVFIVPIAEMGETPFEDEVPAQLLIRWMMYVEMD